MGAGGSSWLRWTRRVVVGALLVLVLAAAWLGYRLYQAGTALKDARDTMPNITSKVGSTALAGLVTAAPVMLDDLARARTASDDPVWRLAEKVPMAGDQLSAVRAVTESLDDLLTASAPILDRAAAVLSARETLLVGGRVDLTPFEQVAPQLQHAAAVSSTSAARVAAINRSDLVGVLARPVGSVQKDLPRIASALDTGAQLAALLPPMLGADGPRTYLVVALNSAELRSAGGIVGSVAAVQVDHGVIRLVDQRSTKALKSSTTSVLPLTDAELAVDTDRLGRFVQDAVLTPDFPRSAQLIAARWQQEVGTPVDGVVATDPVAVSYVLRSVGKVDAGPVSLDAHSAVTALLRDPYRQGMDADAADAYFAQAAAAIFSAVASGHAKPAAFVDALTQAAGEGRVRVWSSHVEEQQRIGARTLGAAFLSGSYADATGVFLNDGTGGKLGYYLHADVKVENLRCSGSSPTADVRVDLTYDPPSDVASMTPSVLGRAGDAPVGSLVTNVSVYAPRGAALPSLRVGDAFLSGLTATVDGRAVQVVSSTLAPGDSLTYRATVPVRDGHVEVWTTPTVRSGGFVFARCPTVQ